jgi:hypothetical protein
MTNVAAIHDQFDYALLDADHWGRYVASHSCRACGSWIANVDIHARTCRPIGESADPIPVIAITGGKRKHRRNRR